MDNEKDARLGTVAAIGAYLMWGLLPIYWKQLQAVDPFQILCHRIIWAALLTLVLLALGGRLSALVSLFRDRKRVLFVAGASLLITVNWGTYIWAVNSGHVTESSLGYYINPLVSVALGAIFFHEAMDRFTTAAIAIAAFGVAAASILAGTLPWISLLLALTFGFYGLVKKKAGLEPLVGLAAETLFAAPFALAYIFFRHSQGLGAFGQGPFLRTALLAFSGVVTALPLLCFAAAANRISLTRMGFIQYLSPSLQLVLGLAVYAEVLRPPMLVAFASVIVAVAIYVLSREGANMEERAFVDRGQLPAEQGIREALGKAASYYSAFETMSDDCTKEWKYHNRRYGWTLKVSRRKKPIYWTTVLHKHFLLGCHLQEDERQAALALDLSDGTRRIIESAKKFPEGYGIELTIKDEPSFMEVKAILGILLESRP